MAEHTPGPWRTEAVSDAVRGAPPQIREEETHADARLMAVAPDLLEVVREVARYGNVFPYRTGEESLYERAKRVIAMAEGNLP